MSPFGRTVAINTRAAPLRPVRTKRRNFSRAIQRNGATVIIDAWMVYNSGSHWFFFSFGAKKFIYEIPTTWDIQLSKTRTPILFIFSKRTFHYSYVTFSLNAHQMHRILHCGTFPTSSYFFIFHITSSTKSSLSYVFYHPISIF
jgi:hypothetical protein